MLIALIVVSSAYSQSSLNDYKYVIVPNKFDFLKEKDQYQINSLAAFLFKKYGFIAVKEGSAYPSDLANNRCLALRSDVIKGSGLFKTKLHVELKDCSDQVIYTSQVGESREKEYKKSYIEALRNAFLSFETVDYAYVPNEKNAIVSNQTTTKNENEAVKEIQKLKEELQTLKKEKEAKAVPTVIAQPIKKAPVVNKTKVVKAATVKQSSSNVLYAQETENGFQLVDSSPKVVYKIIKTGVDNVFLVESLSAIIYKKDNVWLLEHLTGSTIIKEPLNIKF